MGCCSSKPAEKEGEGLTPVAAETSAPGNPVAVETGRAVTSSTAAVTGSATTTREPAAGSPTSAAEETHKADDDEEGDEGDLVPDTTYFDSAEEGLPLLPSLTFPS